MGFVSRQALQDLYLRGTFQKSATIAFPEIGGIAGYPVEAVVADTNGHIIGECWISDVQYLINFGKKELQNTGKKNPNLLIIEDALKEMLLIRQKVQELAEEIAAPPPSAKIIPFPASSRRNISPSWSRDPS